MAEVVVSLKIMPESPEIDLDAVQSKAMEAIKAFTNMDEMKASQEPVAFGLKSVNLVFVMSEDQGSTDELEKTIADMEGVNSVEVTDVRRAMG